MAGVEASRPPCVACESTAVVQQHCSSVKAGGNQGLGGRMWGMDGWDKGGKDECQAGGYLRLFQDAQRTTIWGVGMHAGGRGRHDRNIYQVHTSPLRGDSGYIACRYAIRGQLVSACAWCLAAGNKIAAEPSGPKGPTASA